MIIKIMMFSVMLLSASSALANTSQYKTPAELTWSEGDETENCIGGVCAKVGEDVTPGMFDRVDKADRQRMKEPRSFRGRDMEDNQGKTLHFSFGDQD